MFTVPGQPIPKGRPRLGRRGHVFTPVRTKRYETKVATYAALAGASARQGRVYMSIQCYMGDKRKRDLDNVGKAISDSLNEVAYFDDEQVDMLLIERYIDKKEPRAVIQIWYIDGD